MVTYGRYPLTVTSGAGCTLTDSTGKSYLDFVAGIATCALGHSNTALTAAVTKQMSSVHHTSNLYYHENQYKLAAWLCDNSAADKAFFCNSGAESVEAAIKLCRKHASKRGVTDPVIITAHASFHGRTLAAVTATAQPKYHKGFTYGKKMVPGFAHCNYNDVQSLKKAVKKYSRTPLLHKLAGRKRRVAGIILEPLQGEGGIRPGCPGFFKKARDICDETGALLVMDEVQAGMGRTGTLWGYEQVGVVPDAFCTAKALGGGIPIGAMCAAASCAETFGPGDHASTYGGNPLACAAGLEVARQFEELDLVRNARERGAQLAEGLRRIAREHPGMISEVRGRGLLLGAEISPDRDVMAAAVVARCMEEGLLLVPAGAKVVRFVPPLIVTEEEVERALVMFGRVVEEMSGKGEEEEGGE